MVVKAQAKPSILLYHYYHLCGKEAYKFVYTKPKTKVGNGSKVRKYYHRLTNWQRLQDRSDHLVGCCGLNVNSRCSVLQQLYQILLTRLP